MTVAPAAPSGCTLVALLRGSAGYNGRSGEANASSVEIYLRNQTAERGGDALVITARQLGAGEEGDTLSRPRGAAVSGGCPNCVSMTAHAYRCPPARTAAATGSPARPGAPAAEDGRAPRPPGATVPVPEVEPPFSERAAAAAMASAARSARACGDEGGPRGEARVKVTFAPTGDVVYSETVGAPFAASVTGECVARKFRNARVPPFAGEARTLDGVVQIGE